MHLSFKVKSFLLLVFMFMLFNSLYVLADDNANEPEYITIDRVNFRMEPNTDAGIIATLPNGTEILMAEYDEDNWSKVIYNSNTGYIKSEFIMTKENYAKLPKSQVELLNWSEVKNIFTIGVDAKVYDVRTGLTYYVRSFSNGLHADVEPVTKEDTAIMLKTYNGTWQWDPRPVWVTINGRTMAASINGMPHGGGVNNSNGMDGQVCIHFRGCTTHNGNKAFAQDHQDGVTEAWNAR